MDIDQMREELLTEWPWESMRKKLIKMSDYDIQRVYTTTRTKEVCKPVQPKPQQICMDFGLLFKKEE